MSKWVSPIEKRNFLRWFLENHKLKRSEARKVIEYLVNNSHILENVSFTEDILLNKKTIVIASMNSDEPGFIFYYHQRKTDEVSMALSNLMMNPSEKVNLILHFRGKMLNHRYLQLIGNPVSDNIKVYERFKQYKKEADDIIEKILLEKEIERLKKQIDEALDQKDEELFTRLTLKLKDNMQKRR